MGSRSNEIKGHIKRGDVILIIPEYSDIFNGSNMLIELLVFYPEGSVYLEFANYISMLVDSPLAIQRRFNGIINFYCYGIKKNTDPVYNAKAFNGYGDVVSHLQLASRSRLSGNVSIDARELPYGYESEVLSVISKFQKLAFQKGAKVIFGFPAVPAEYTKGRENLPLLYRHLKSKLSIKILGKPQDLVFPQCYFYDTVYHLNSLGRNERTRILISDLKQLLRELEKKPVTGKRGFSSCLFRKLRPFTGTATGRVENFSEVP